MNEYRVTFSHLLRGIAAEGLQPIVRQKTDPAAEAAAQAAAAEAAQRERLENLLQEVSESVRELEQRRRQSLHELQRAAVEVALSVASHLVHQKLESNDWPVESLVQQALEQLGLSQPVTVRLHPADLQLLQQRDASRWQQAEQESQLQLQADASLERGSCLADAGELGLLATMDRQLETIRRTLLQGLDHAQVERRAAHPGGGSLRRFPDRRETA